MTMRSLPEDFASRSLEDQRKWVATTILAAHRFPLGHGPLNAEDAASKVEWKNSLNGVSFTCQLKGGILGRNKPIDFYVNFKGDTCHPRAIQSARPTMLLHVSPRHGIANVGKNPYQHGSASHDIHVPGVERPVSASLTFAIKALRAAAASSPGDDQVSAAIVTLDDFLEQHGPHIGNYFNGMVVAMHGKDDLLQKGPDTVLGRALDTCIRAAGERIDRNGLNWIAPVVSSYWVDLGDTIESKFEFSKWQDPDLLSPARMAG